MYYEVDKERIEKFLKEVKPSSVLVEAPPGLWREADEVCKMLKEKGIDCIRSAIPVFGACLVFEHFAGDAVIHLGHYPYPWWRPRKPTLFLEASWKGKVNWGPLVDVLSGKVLLASPAQHVKQLYELKDILKRKGIEANLAKGFVEGLILGCDYSGLKEGYDHYVIVAGGVFHALGAALYLGRKIIKFDPYTSKVEEVDPYPVLKKRMWKVSEAIEGKKVAIIDGIEGQSRPQLLESLKREAERNGFEVKVFKASILTRDFMIGILEEVDFAVTLSCPRLALDDFGDLHKPVLAPGEARAAFRRDLERYSFPW
ncbi:dihydrofolate reductase [Ignicoccus pacificus DSM 13166]|uniref:2-(3-amino-3-carboxypropyl)histidine synthase n=1 Tax=Ignicoccus pacificus DSM 13166 TaxID=940294 RepID=A0A977K950_9CREN|nr:dihydrofolate reductase [Ignicoccus pacificus DSM 13166]